MSDSRRNMSNLKQNGAQVSIIIPTYNESENIIQILESIGEYLPKYTAVEVIVIDDNSPDGTGKIVEDHVNDPRNKAGSVSYTHLTLPTICSV